MNWTIHRAGLALSVILALLPATACKRNHPPSTPDVTGLHTARPRDTVMLSATSSDQDEDLVSYLFAWGDTSSAVWSPDYPSGVAVTRGHAYAESGAYAIRARARDDKGAESDWSVAETLLVGIFPPGTPVRPMGPSSGLTGEVYRCSTHATSPYAESLLIQFDWGELFGDWSGPVASDSSYVADHVFELVGTYMVRARAADRTGQVSLWSDSIEVTIASDDTTAPVVGIVLPANGDTVSKGDIAVNAVATDNKAVTKVEFYVDGALLGTDSIGGAGDTFRWVWTDTAAQVVWQQYELVAKAYDAAQHEKSSATVTINIVGGYVAWYWWSSDPENGEEPLTTSVIVANDGTDEVVLGSCDGDYRFYSIRAGNGHSKKSQTTKEIEASFSGHPGLANGHIIVGSDEGELYALSLRDNLNKDWQYPDSAVGRGTYIQWGAPAFNGYNFYVGHDDDSIFKFSDNGVSCTRVAAYGLQASVVDAPIVDATGNVIFGTDSAYLYKMDANLSSVIWRVLLLNLGEVYGPILGSDGTIYCATDSNRLYAIDPTDGSVKTGWPVNLDGEVTRPALGQSALFVATRFGKAYSINPATGAINWKIPLSTTDGFSTTPVVTANGYVYFQSRADILYCVNQADGTVIWSCDCPSYLPHFGGGGLHRPRKTQLTYYRPNPSILSNGNVIVVGHDACYCVVGYPEGPLDPAAAWPKWQKDLYNSGK